MMYKVLIAFLSLLRKWLHGWAGSKLRVVKLIGIGTERISDVGQKPIPSFHINFQLLMILSSFPHHQGYTYFVPTNSIFNDVKSSLLVPWVELWLARPLADLALGLTWAHQPPSGVSRKLVQKTRSGDTDTIMNQCCEGLSRCSGSRLKRLTRCKYGFWGGNSKSHLDRGI